MTGSALQCLDVLFSAGGSFLYRGGVRGGEDRAGLGAIGGLADFCLGSFYMCFAT